MNNINPITKLDYPDPEVIRVEDTYYMVSTTMYFMPGCEILRSYDLVNWEHAAYVYDTLDGTAAQKLEGKENVYGCGMWAASLSYYKDVYYVCFVANDTHKTYIYQAKDIYGPWEKYTLEDFYHDNSILFDDDGKIYIVYGNTDIYLKELKFDAAMHLTDVGTEPAKLILSDKNEVYLGYEGSHFYKINGKYYIFLIHMPKSTGKRTEAVFVADKPEGPYYGKDVMDDDRGYRNSGVAQGSIVDSPSGKWYGILFQDSGAVGRIPCLMPVTWGKRTIGEGKDVDFPVLGEAGKIPEEFEIEDLNPGYKYAPLVASDDFKADYNGTPSSSYGFKPCWQFNHEPDLSLVKRDLENGNVTVTTDKISSNLVQAKNTLTQRTLFPGCEADVTVDANGIKDGDYAGLSLLESNYGFIAVTKRDTSYYLVMGKRELENKDIWGERNDDEPFEEVECVLLDSPVVTLHAAVCFDNKTIRRSKQPSLIPDSDDTVSFFYKSDSEHLKKLGSDHKLEFKLDHFTGVRFGLFIYSTKEIGGSASFSDFIYV
ncbi:MAG: family 43 glycosylhydrolase [Butyrivibrio sp.]|nr:family 43 glycosylhydrolase [Butyrivibrio sp.]